MYTVLTLAHVHCTHRHWDSSAYPRADPSKSIHSIAYIPLNIFFNRFLSSFAVSVHIPNVFLRLFAGHEPGYSAHAMEIKEII